MVTGMYATASNLSDHFVIDCYFCAGDALNHGSHLLSYKSVDNRTNDFHRLSCYDSGREL